MLETVAIPILLKAVDFLFGEGSKILTERRERHKAQQETGKVTPALQPVAGDKLLDVIQSKDVALGQPVKEAAWLADLQIELEHAQGVLIEKPESFEALGEISKQVVVVSSETQETTVWEDKQLEGDVLRTKLSGLLTQLNIQTSILNRYQIEKAKHGGQLVPPRLEIAIDDISKEITETEARVREVRTQLAALNTSSSAARASV